MHFGVVKREERYLAAKFGDAYRQYMETRAALRLAVLTAPQFVQAFPGFVPLPRAKSAYRGMA